MQWKKTMATTAVAVMMTLALTGCGGSMEEKYTNQINSFNESLSKVETTYKGKKLGSEEIEKALREGFKGSYKLASFEEKNEKELDSMNKQLKQEEQAYKMGALFGVLDQANGTLDAALGNSTNKKQMDAAKQKQEDFKKWYKEHEGYFSAVKKSKKVSDAYFDLFPSNVQARKLMGEAFKRIGNAHQWDPDVNIDKLSFQEIFGVKSVNELMGKTDATPAQSVEQGKNNGSANQNANVSRDKLDKAADAITKMGFSGARVSATSYGHSDKGFIATVNGAFMIFDVKNHRYATIWDGSCFNKFRDLGYSKHMYPVLVQFAVWNDTHDQDENAGYWDGNRHLIPINMNFKYEGGQLVDDGLFTANGRNATDYQTYLFEQKNVDLAHLFAEEALPFIEDAYSRGLWK